MLSLTSFTITFQLQKCNTVGDKRRRQERRKRQKAHKMQAKHLLRNRNFSRLESSMLELKAENIATQKAYERVNENVHMLHVKYEKLKHVYLNVKTESKAVKSKLVKVIRKDQLVPVQDQTQSDIILGECHGNVIEHNIFEPTVQATVHINYLLELFIVYFIEIKDRTAFLILNTVLQQKTGKKKGVQEGVFTIIPRSSALDRELENFVQPKVVAVGTLYDMDELYIVCEGCILCPIPQEKVVDSILALMASFYIFNIEYNEGKAVLSFLEKALLGIGRGQTLVTITSC